MSNTVNTVTGPLSVDQLGVTLMHEHLLIGYPGWEADTLRPGPSREQMVATCVGKIESMQAIGVQSMLDPCPNDLGRDVTLAREVAERTGFNIVCATGLYKQDEGGFAHWHFRRETGSAVAQMAELFIHELTHGIGDTGVKAGIIKVATGVGEITDYEYCVLEAAALAATETGAPITTHTDEGTMGDAQQRFLTERGVPAHRIIIGHSCGSADHDYHMGILDGGSYLGFDRFGLDILVPDSQRVDALVKLLKKNREHQIVVSHDGVWCTRGEPFPAELVASMDPDVLFDPTHFHRNIVPQLLAAGVSQRQIDTLLVDNPRRFFAGEVPPAVGS
ncbi:phosphotriesterase family protein [Parahaliea mediterranea]|uniref:phosphotriesterase family protein n=1 Tax=Parahaliea mediterranea TaxID=651086 RepID=UPI000E2F681D|nr:phosphotriesterase-related protein [Parahaliea mediterranea]